MMMMMMTMTMKHSTSGNLLLHPTCDKPLGAPAYCESCLLWRYNNDRDGFSYRYM